MKKALLEIQGQLGLDFAQRVRIGDQISGQRWAQEEKGQRSESMGLASQQSVKDMEKRLFCFNREAFTQIHDPSMKIRPAIRTLEGATAAC